MPPRHTVNDVERGLTALAITNSSYRAADMTGFNERTIRKWREQHPERYADITAKRAALIDQACIAEFREVVLDATAATRQAVALTRTHLEHDASLPARRHELLEQLQAADEDTRGAIVAELQSLHPAIKDSSASAKNLATTAAISADKIAIMEGRPTSIIEHRSADDVLDAMSRRGYVDAHATEEPPTPLLPARACDNAR